MCLEYGVYIYKVKYIEYVDGYWCYFDFNMIGFFV